MKKKVFITGISSLIMKKLCDFIDFSEYEILGISRNPLLFSQKNIKIIKADITNLNDYEHYLEDCEIIIHAAAVTHSFNENKYFEINFEATKKIVDSVKQLNIKNFVYISSNTAHEKSGAYAKSKLLAERYIQENLKHWLIFRPSEIYGKDCKDGIESLIRNAISKPLIGCPKEMIYSFSPIHSSDAVKLIFESIFIKKSENEIKIVNGNKKFTFQELIALIKKTKNKKLYVVYINKKLMFFIKRIAEIIPFSVGVIPDQIERLYGFKSYDLKHNYCTIDIEDYIEKIIDD